MREAFAHEALVELAPGSDERAVGGAITVALCGHWEHEGPCMWPHHTSVQPSGSATLVRTVFACPAQDEPEVRRRLRLAIASGSLESSTWTVRQDGSTSVRESEADLAIRLARG